MNQETKENYKKRMYDVIVKDYNLSCGKQMDMRHKDINDMIVSGMSIAEVKLL